METFQRCLSAMDVKLCKYVFCLILPFLLIPLAISPSQEYRCAYVIIFVASYWIFGPVPIAVPSLLPLFLFPLLGILDSKDVCSCYMKESIMTFSAGIMLAIAIEHCMLHERIAMKVLLLLGTSMKRLTLGFLLVTMFLSMWISNTATTAMLIPIVEAIVENMDLQQSTEVGGGEITTVSESTNEVVLNVTQCSRRNTSRKATENRTHIKTTLLLCICYAANIGGTGTLIGTIPNMLLKGFVDDLFPGNEAITFTTWMMYNVPVVLLCTVAAWGCLYGIHTKCSNEAQHCNSQYQEDIRKVILNRYQSLGNITFSEFTVMISFVAVVFLWILRDPDFMTGWTKVISIDNAKIGDSMPAMLVVFLLFLVPAQPLQIRTSSFVLEWKLVQRKFPWSVIFLIGASLALASGAQKSGLSALLGSKLIFLSDFPPVAILTITCLLTTMITEMMSNTATISILMPVLYQMAVTMGINPLYLLIPATGSCSYAFMLPIATVTNILVFEAGHFPTMQMVKPGFIMNLVCCGIHILMINTLGAVIFNINEYPQWANQTLTTTEPII